MDVNITIRLSERLEIQLERLLELLTTATHRWEEDDDDDNDED